jgi:hypothetical protein
MLKVHFIPVRMTTLKNTNKKCGEKGPPYLAGGNVN